MKFSSTQIFLVLSSLISASAFTVPHANTIATRHPTAKGLPALHMSTSAATADVDEVERLRSMAAKLRAEAASLQAEQSRTMASAVEKIFRKFDLDQNGELSLQELKAGLEKTFQIDLSESRVQQLMSNFDKSGDGVLQLEEFVGAEQFRNHIDALIREERALELEVAQREKAEQAMMQQLDEQLAVINDSQPTGTDKLVSVLPYLLPLLDSLQYARFFVLEHPNNALAGAVGFLYALYRSVPLSGFLAVFALSSLSRNPGINRLVRFNMQQAIFVDVALLIPGLVAAVAGMAGSNVPAELVEISTNAFFVSVLGTIAYAASSSLLGRTPNKIPFVSNAVNTRVPTVEDIKSKIILTRSQDENGDDTEKEQ